MRMIATSRLTLEPQVAGHAEEMFGVLSDPAIRFHAKFGFREVGTHSYNNKRVSLQATSPAADPAARSSTAPRR